MLVNLDFELNFPLFLSLYFFNPFTPVGKAILCIASFFIFFLKSIILSSHISLSSFANILLRVNVIKSLIAGGKLLLTISKPLTSSLSHLYPPSLIICCPYLFFVTQKADLAIVSCLISNLCSSMFRNFLANRS